MLRQGILALLFVAACKSPPQQPAKPTANSENSEPKYHLGCLIKDKDRKTGTMVPIHCIDYYRDQDDLDVVRNTCKFDGKVPSKTSVSEVLPGKCDRIGVVLGCSDSDPVIQGRTDHLYYAAWPGVKGDKCPFTQIIP